MSASLLCICDISHVLYALPNTLRCHCIIFNDRYLLFSEPIMSAVNAVKKRMAEMRDGIDEAEIRMKESEQLKREAIARCTTAEGEAASLRSRVAQLQAEIDRVNKKLEEQSTRIDSAESRTQDNDTTRKELEERETDNDQDLILLEQSTKDTKVLFGNIQRIYYYAPRPRPIIGLPTPQGTLIFLYYFSVKKTNKLS